MGEWAEESDIRSPPSREHRSSGNWSSEKGLSAVLGQRGSRRFRWWQIVVIALVVVILAAAAGAFAAVKITGASTSCDTVKVARDSLPAVVTVFATGPSGSGSGSGAVIRSDGVILTNDHVIADAVPSGTIEVLFNDGERVAAAVTGTDPITDLAVLKVNRSRLPILSFGVGAHLAVGQPVVALGAPLGLSGTVTAGIISSLDRNVPAPKATGGTTILAGTIQTDAAINPGNSGGPLVTCNSALVGVNTAISTVPDANGDAVGGSVGIGFAVPASTAQRISGELLANGRATHPWIGAQTVEISQSAAAKFGTTAGLFVQDVTAGGPAAQAGLQKGDIITRLNASDASSVSLAWLLVSAQIGESVQLQVVREGSRHQTTITLAEQP